MKKPYCISLVLIFCFGFMTQASAEPFATSSRYYPDYTYTTQGGITSVRTSGQTFIYMRQGENLYRITPMSDGRYWFGYVWPKLADRIEESHASSIINLPANVDPVTLVINGKTVTFQAPSKIAQRKGEIPVRTTAAASPQAAPPRVTATPQTTQPQAPAGWNQGSVSLCQLTGSCGGAGGSTGSSSGAGVGSSGGSGTGGTVGNSSSSGGSTNVGSGNGSPGESVCAKNYTQVWQSPLREADLGKQGNNVFSANNQAWGNLARNSCGAQRPQHPASSCSNFTVGRAPDNTPALQMHVPKGTKYYVALRNSVLPANTYKACASVQIFVPNYWRDPTPKAGMKLGLGLWGGGKGSCAAGGCSGPRQDGFTMRLEAGTNLHPHLYSYHLNRTSGDFGQTKTSPKPLPKGRWVTLEQELIMESAPGKADGVENMYMDGERVATMTGLNFGRDRGWYIKGYNFDDLWGGHSWEHQSPIDQTYWYRDLRVYK